MSNTIKRHWRCLDLIPWLAVSGLQRSSNRICPRRAKTRDLRELQITPDRELLPFGRPPPREGCIRPAAKHRSGKSSCSNLLYRSTDEHSLGRLRSPDETSQTILRDGLRSLN